MYRAKRYETRRCIIVGTILLLLIGSTALPTIVGYVITHMNKHELRSLHSKDPKPVNEGGVHFSNDLVHVGRIEASSEPVKAEYRFVNRSDRPVRVCAVKVDSDCINSEYINSWILPNMHGAITLIFDARQYHSRKRCFDYNAFVFFEGASSKHLPMLRITGEVVETLSPK